VQEHNVCRAPPLRLRTCDGQSTSQPGDPRSLQATQRRTQERARTTPRRHRPETHAELFLPTGLVRGISVAHSRLRSADISQSLLRSQIWRPHRWLCGNVNCSIVVRLGLVAVIGRRYGAIFLVWRTSCHRVVHSTQHPDDHRWNRGDRVSFHRWDSCHARRRVAVALQRCTASGVRVPRRRR